MGFLTKLYNKQVARKTYKFNPDSKPSFSPSQIGGKCSRKLYYSYSKAPQERVFPLKVIRMMEAGTAVGDMLIATFKKAGVVIDYHNPDGSIPINFEKVNREFPVSALEFGIKKGYIDMVYVNPETNTLHLAEFKSISENGYSFLGGTAKKDHLVQGVLYFHLFNYALKVGVYKHIKALESFKRAESIVFYYYNKNSSYSKEFEVTNTSPIFLETIDKIKSIQAIKTTKVLPKKTKDFCDDCSYQKRCIAEELAPRDGGLLTIK